MGLEASEESLFNECRQGARDSDTEEVKIIWEFLKEDNLVDFVLKEGAAPCEIYLQAGRLSRFLRFLRKRNESRSEQQVCDQTSSPSGKISAEGSLSGKPYNKTYKRKKRSLVDILTDDSPSKMAVMHSAYFAQAAADYVTVRRFRKRILGGRLLSDEQAWQFITSSPAAYLPRDMFEELGIPFLGQSARMVDKWHDEEEDIVYLNAEIRVEPAGVTCRVRIPYPPIFEDDGPFDPSEDPTPYIWFLGSDCLPILKVIYKDSVLYDLARIGDRLCEMYPWEEAEATRFVLTGETPTVFKVSATVKPCATKEGSLPIITVRAVAGTPTQQVIDRYCAVVEDELGMTNRQQEESKAEMFLFINEEKRLQGASFSFEKSRRRWNALHPEWRYDHADSMRQAYQRTKNALLTRSAKSLERWNRIWHAVFVEYRKLCAKHCSEQKKGSP